MSSSPPSSPTAVSGTDLSNAASRVRAGSTAADDIARLYSRLQAVIASVPPSPLPKSPPGENLLERTQPQDFTSVAAAAVEAGASEPGAGRQHQSLNGHQTPNSVVASASSLVTSPSPPPVRSPSVPAVSAAPPSTPLSPPPATGILPGTHAADKPPPPPMSTRDSDGRTSRPPSGSVNARPPPQRPQRSSRRPVSALKVSLSPVEPVAVSPTSSDVSAAETMSLATANGEAGVAERVRLSPMDAPRRSECEVTPEVEWLLQRVAELESRLRDKTQEVDSLTRDLDSVSKKCVEHVDKLADVQQIKEQAENELEDLSRQLFETANGMVADEARARHQLETAQRTLQAKLDETLEALSNERSQLRELKRRMEEMSLEHDEGQGVFAFQHRRGSQDIINRRSMPSHRRSLSDLTGLQSNKVQVATGNCSNGIPEEFVEVPPPDDAVMQEFEMFVRQLPETPLRRLHSLPFMKHCLEEEVDCCLRFMPASRLTTRRLVDAIVNNTCSVEDSVASAPATPSQSASPAASLPSSPQPIRAARQQTTQLWERFTQGLLPLEPGDCHACGRPEQCTFRFRLADDDPWAPIDGFCRDRIVAACEFYVFIRNLRLGLYGSRPVEDLYAECTRLRLQMFFAKVGALPWAEVDMRVPEKPSWAVATVDVAKGQHTNVARITSPTTAQNPALAVRTPRSSHHEASSSEVAPDIVVRSSTPDL